MPEAHLYNVKREKVGTVMLPESVFSVAWKGALVKQALDAQLANRRIPWAKAKDRSEVRGGGRKPWRQKGTGRARHGSTRSPIWVGGGKSHGPVTERDYSQKLNKKMRRAAIAMLLSKKLADGELIMLDTFALAEPKTKLLASELRTLTQMGKTKKKFDALLVPSAEEKGIHRAGRNLPKAKVAHPATLNVYDLMNYKHVVLQETAVADIERSYGKK